MEERLKAPLRAAIAFLEEHGYRYAIIGGIALAQWGAIRVTRNIDIKVLVPNLDYTAIRDALRKRFPKPARPHAPDNPLIIAVEIGEIIVDFLLAVPGYEEQIIERAVRRDLGGFSAWVCSAEDLIIQKIYSGRGKDWLDVEALLVEQHGKLDEAYIEDWLMQFAEALEKPEIVAEYRRLVEKIKAVS